MNQGKLKIATCQFAVSGSIDRNAGHITEYIRRAARARADIVHFPECALSGYIGADLDCADQLDWTSLCTHTHRIMQLAARYRLWVVLGSTHRLTHPHKPHNSLYLINPKGKIANRYDKRFCTSGDLDHYSPGDRFVTFDINGIRCALLICFDLRFAELYRQLKKKRVDCILQSFYNARQAGPSVHTHIMRQTMQCRAASNYFWISMANASACYAPYASCFIQPDGVIAAQLPRHRPGIMFNTVDLNRRLYDPAAPFRSRAIKGILTNGMKINDPRSKKTTIV